MKKVDLINSLIAEFNNNYISLKDKKRNELKNICKLFKIKCRVTSKKNDLILSILNYLSTNFIFTLNNFIFYH